MTAWIAPWHLIPMDALHQWLRRSLLRVQAVLAGHCVVLAWRIHPAYALRLMKALALAETTTAVQPVVLRPVQVQVQEVKQEIVGLRPFAVKVGLPLCPQVSGDLLQGFARQMGQTLQQYERMEPDWEAHAAMLIAKAALAIGADRVDDALRKLAGWDRDTAAKAEDLVADAEAELHPWPSNERLADGDY